MIDVLIIVLIISAISISFAIWQIVWALSNISLELYSLNLTLKSIQEDIYDTGIQQRISNKRFTQLIKIFKSYNRMAWKKKNENIL